MPTYAYQCGECHARQDIIKRLALLDAEEPCPKCSTPMHRILTPPMVRGDYQGYDCPISGKWIEGKRAHEENLKRHGCRLLEPGESDQYKERLSRENDAFEARIADTAAEFVEKLPTVKREQLGKELESGAAASFQRQ